MAGVVRASAWDLAVECVDRAVEEGAAPSLERLGRLGQLGSLPSFVAALGGDDDPSELAEDFARERESLGLAPGEVAGELLVLGLDSFKERNDSEGHQEGDRLLRVFASALERTARETDSVGRLGGDEFGALLLEADASTADAFLHRLREHLPDGPAASAGASFLPAEGTTPEELLGLADRRL